jgi:hypothetical protein
MNDTNKKLDRHLRRSSIRKVLLVTLGASLFIGLMSFMLYKGYGPDAEIVDYLSKPN